MRTESKAASKKKEEMKRVKGKVKKAFYYEGKLVVVGAIVDGHRHDFEQWPSKVEIVTESTFRPSSTDPASGTASEKSAKKFDKKEEK